MRQSNLLFTFSLAGILVTGAALSPRAQAVEDSSLSFFITSSPIGQGGNFGGLSGADAHCQSLAAGVGAGNKVWRAYLSTQAAGGTAAVNAKDRIGPGPWFNANKVKVASNVAELHGTNNLTKQTAVTQTGVVVTGRGDSPNLHDLITGTKANGMAPATGADSTCANWTNSGASAGRTIVGHHDRMGIASNIDPQSWMEAHVTTGCSQTSVIMGGGAGYFYCFADKSVTAVDPRTLRREIGPASGYAPYLLSPGRHASEIVYRYTLEEEARVEVTVYDADGRERVVLERARRKAGNHVVRWSGTDESNSLLPPGLYHIVLKRDGQVGR